MILKKENFSIRAKELYEVGKIDWLDEAPYFFYKYNSALKNLSAVLESIDEEFRIQKEHNPIHHIESRIKSIKSLCGKMKSKNLPVELDVAEKEITDIAGVRVICNYVDDIYYLVKKLNVYFENQIIKVRDYIKEPKSNGYRSFHMVIKIPIFVNEKREDIPVEIQLRTIAMEMWASLEHELHYKTEIKLENTENDLLIREKLRICSLTMKLIDESMLEIYKEIKGID